MSVIVKNPATGQEKEVASTRLAYWQAQGWDVASARGHDRTFRELVGPYAERRGPHPAGVTHIVQKDTWNGWDGQGRTFTAAQLAAEPLARVNFSASSLASAGSGALTNKTGPAGAQLGKSFEEIIAFEGDFIGMQFLSYAQAHANVRFWLDGIPLTQWTEITGAGSTVRNGRWTRYPLNDAGTYRHCLLLDEPGTHQLRVAGHEFVPETAPMLVLNKDGALLPTEDVPLLLAVGDSYYDVWRSTMTVPQHLAARLGWRHWNVAQAGTGYLAPGSDGSHQFGSDAVIDAARKVPKRPSLISINGLGNDVVVGATPAQIEDAARSTFARYGREFPGVPIIATGCQQLPGASATTLDAADNALLEAAADSPNLVRFVFPRSINWITGTGNTANLQGDGNRDRIIGSDDVHLGTYGTDALAGLLEGPILGAPVSC